MFSSKRRSITEHPGPNRRQRRDVSGVGTLNECVAKRVLGYGHETPLHSAISRPVSFSDRSSLSGYPYAISDKLDGVHCILILGPEGLTRHNATGDNCALSCLGSPGLLLLEAEHLEDGGADRHVYFDCLIAGGKDMRPSPLAMRLAGAREAIHKAQEDDVLRTLLVPKVHVVIGHDTDPGKVMQTGIRSNARSDGMILTPLLHAYASRPPVKYKPTVTTDFVIGTGATSGNRFALTLRSFAAGGRPQLVPFVDSSAGAVSPLVLECSIEAPDGAVVEVDIATRAVVRLRRDRKKPNNERVALDNSSLVSRSMHCMPVAASVLSAAWSSCEAHSVYRLAWNAVKRVMIAAYCAGRRVVDIGAGCGGDVLKYHAAGAHHVTLIEPDPKRCSQMCEVLHRKSLTSKFEVVESSIQTYLDTPSEPVEVAVMFFSLNQILMGTSVRGLADVLRRLRVNHVICIVLDSAAFRLHVAGGIRESNMVAEEDEEGHVMRVHLSGSRTAEEVLERAIDFENLQKDFSEVGFRLAPSPVSFRSVLSSFDEISDLHLRLGSSYRTCVFEKEPHEFYIGTP